MTFLLKLLISLPIGIILCLGVLLAIALALTLAAGLVAINSVSGLIANAGRSYTLIVNKLTGASR